jgi:hypothetical protein
MRKKTQPKLEMIILTHTPSDPWAMMIEFHYTFSTAVTMFHPISLLKLTNFTKLSLRVIIGMIFLLLCLMS